MVQPEAATCAGPGSLAGQPLLGIPLLDSGCGECQWVGPALSLPARWDLGPADTWEGLRAKRAAWEPVSVAGGWGAWGGARRRGTQGLAATSSR